MELTSQSLGYSQIWDSATELAVIPTYANLGDHTDLLVISHQSYSFLESFQLIVKYMLLLNRNIWHSL